MKVHGVFPSRHRYSASSRKIQFHWVSTGDSGNVVTSFMRDGTYPPRSFATLEPSEYSCRWSYLDWKLWTVFIMLGHWADVRRNTSSYEFATSCVFIKQSHSPFKCWPYSLKLFVPRSLPKLQRDFAEFLQYCYLKRLSIFYQFTCVGLQYGLFHVFSCHW